MAGRQVDLCGPGYSPTCPRSFYWPRCAPRRSSFWFLTDHRNPPPPKWPQVDGSSGAALKLSHPRNFNIPTTFVPRSRLSPHLDRAGHAPRICSASLTPRHAPAWRGFFCLRVDRGRTGDVDDSRTRDRIEFLGPQLSLEELKQAITTRLVDQIGSTWDERYGELPAFKETHGHCGVPVSFVTPNGHALGRWVGKQRKKRGKSFSRANDQTEWHWICLGHEHRIFGRTGVY